MTSSSGYDTSATTVYSQLGQLKKAQLQALQCSACQLILREPMQVIACGHRFCRCCIQTVMDQGWVNGEHGMCCIDQPFPATEMDHTDAPWI